MEINIKIADQYRKIDLNKIALCAIDVQNDFIDGALGSAEAQKAVEVIEKIADVDFGYNFFTFFDTHYENTYLRSLEGHYLSIPHCIRETDGWYMPDSLEKKFNSKDRVFFEKGSFGSLSLAETLETFYWAGLIDCAIFVGFCSDICVISNILMAKTYVPNLPIIVIEDGCAGVTPELHQAALKIMNSCQVEIVKSKNFLNNISDEWLKNWIAKKVEDNAI